MKRLALLMASILSTGAIAASTETAIITTTIPVICSVAVNTGNTEDSVYIDGTSNEEGYIEYDLTRNSLHNSIDIEVIVEEDDVRYMNPAHGIAQVWNVILYHFDGNYDRKGSFDISDPHRITNTFTGAQTGDRARVEFESRANTINKLRAGDNTLSVTTEVTCP